MNGLVFLTSDAHVVHTSRVRVCFPTVSDGNAMPSLRLRRAVERRCSRRMDSLPMSEARGAAQLTVPPGKGRMIVKRVLIAISVSLCLCGMMTAPRAHAVTIPVRWVQEDPVLDGDPEYPDRTSNPHSIAQPEQPQQLSQNQRSFASAVSSIFLRIWRLVWTIG